jgi:CheY-like chemotaxis protein
MPVIDGFEFYKKIKAIDDRIKACFLTADNDLSEYKINYPDVIEEIECGRIRRFMNKPVPSARLLTMISKVIS